MTPAPSRAKCSATATTDDARAALSRTIPPFSTASRPASNCGFTRATTAPRSRRWRKEGGSASRKRDEGEVRHHEVNGLGQVEALTGVDALHDAHALVVAELPVQLTLPHVDRVDARRAALQDAVGEAAGGRADVEHDHPRHVDAEVVERTLELLAAAGHEARPGFDRDDRVLRHRGRGAVGAVAGDAHRAGEDQRLGALAARCELTLDQQLIETYAACHHAAILAYFAYCDRCRSDCRARGP